MQIGPQADASALLKNALADGYIDHLAFANAPGDDRVPDFHHLFPFRRDFPI